MVCGTARENLIKVVFGDMVAEMVVKRYIVTDVEMVIIIWCVVKVIFFFKSKALVTN